MIPDGIDDETRGGLLSPAIIGPPIVWLASKQANGVHDQRIVATGAAGTSHTSVWQTKTVICGIHVPSVSKTQVLCQASGVPRPPHTSPNDGDPGVVLAAHGKPRLILMFQDEYPAASKIRTFSKGPVWGARGVTCRIASKTVTCSNRSPHGFTIGNGKYTHF